ncbi:nitronate monooxygenase [Polynucleobacter sp. MWH-Spelu-300-X4]|uniref:NAD(P)H-dependent flavin oxidoreductase n=1 Tax=Polynucleobacter sp. MWH-Spelu-300-X4 TaxID=2689109 RepID=UPI001BFD5490|nr:nitronate monooxygenase [Polynucleobacter sp. MWH-Spelu-300-X4]QWD79741.1 nitronate monooxygenase [Polynucleobacter sp. MWH-Spelu-300-X4]
MFNFSKLEIPIIQAPMAGGINNPKLASEVTNAGGVGSFGFAYSAPQKISEDLVATRALTKGPINANFFVFSAVDLPAQAIQAQAIDALRNLPIAGDCSVSIPQAPFYPDVEEQLHPVWEHCPEIVTFHFGIPPLRVIEKAHSLGIAVGVTATSAEEAIAIETAGADFIVAQGIEAGGHRGIFNPSAADEKLTAIHLTKKLVKCCSIPIVCAGAIMDGTDIANALNAGAVAAQLGTAFLSCDESGASPAHKNYLLNQHGRGSVFTKGFSGRLARGIENEFIRLMEDRVTLPFPIQNTMTASLRQLAGKTNNGEYQSLWAGQDYSRARNLSAKDLMLTLKNEFLVAMG